MTQIGLMFEGQAGLTWPRWQRLLKAAEDFGYQCVFRSDHFTIGQPYQESLEAWVSLTYAASHTRRIEFGPLVSPVTFRHPSLLVRMAAAVDDLSSGRLVLGLGAGWNVAEHRQFGIPFYDVPARREMLTDELEIMTRLLRQDKPVTYQGKHFSVEDAVLLPRPQRAGGPPILIGGNGFKKTLPLAARYADEWNAVFATPTDYRAGNVRLSELLEQAGRQPSAVKRSIMTEVIFGADEAALRKKLQQRPEPGPELIVGTPSQVIDKIGEFVEAGAERLMLQWLDLDDLNGIEKLAQTVLPHFHKA
ncbi:MAG TPA: TIGR03560 family F420-dependent LLM class oxidoreductase [Aggregatilineales bacterium]|nr:TIGR03560 family F420-dependent LLM class oxidoreductase [Aggregatilineales bacterium]